MSTQDKVERDEVTINIGMPRPLHRRLSITCAIMDVSLKSALVAGAALWIDENADAVASSLPNEAPFVPALKPRSKGGRAARDAAAREAQGPPASEASPDATPDAAPPSSRGGNGGADPAT